MNLSASIYPDVGKTIPRVMDVAEACNRDPSVIGETPSWRTHVRKHKPCPKKELVETFLRGVWNDPVKYTATQVAKKRCSPSYVESLDIWKEYCNQNHFRKQPANERIRRFLAKDKTGKRKYTRKAVAEALSLCRSFD